MNQIIFDGAQVKFPRSKVSGKMRKIISPRVPLGNVPLKIKTVATIRVFRNKTRRLSLFLGRNSEDLNGPFCRYIQDRILATRMSSIAAVVQEIWALQVGAIYV